MDAEEVPVTGVDRPATTKKCIFGVILAMHAYDIIGGIKEVCRATRRQNVRRGRAMLVVCFVSAIFFRIYADTQGRRHVGACMLPFKRQ